MNTVTLPAATLWVIRISLREEASIQKPETFPKAYQIFTQIQASKTANISKTINEYNYTKKWIQFFMYDNQR
jgi:predicted lysophospholipase L1 biosynthesis ABC-type transport system permease subunit